MENGTGERVERVRRETTALWEAVFGSPPPTGADPEAMLDVILNSSPPQTYTRIGAAGLAHNLTFPRPARSARR